MINIKHTTIRRKRRWLTSAIALTLLFTVGAMETETDTDQPEVMQSNYVDFGNGHQEDLVGSYTGADITPTDRLVCSNRNFLLYYDQTGVEVKVQDRSNGYVWTNAVKEDEDNPLSGTWRRFSRALVVIETINRRTIKPKQQLPDNAGEGYATRYRHDGFEVDVTFEKIGMTITVQFTLTADGLTVSVPDNGIRSNPEQEELLSRMYVLPFFGAAYKNTFPGYIFIPDGSGALIRYTEPGTYRNVYSERIYAKDYSINAAVSENKSNRQSDYLGEIEPYPVCIPVFGMAHGANQNAFLARITGGAEYCELKASPAGIFVDYFWCAPQFIFKEIYWVADHTGFGFDVMQKSTNTVNAQVQYKFLSGDNANYVGMANKYKQLLIDEGKLPDKTPAAGSVPLYVDAFMGEAVKALIGTRTETLSKLSDVNRWIDTLYDNGVGSLVVALRGMEPGGYSERKPDSFKIAGAVGPARELKTLYDKLTPSGSSLSISKDYTQVYSNQTSSNNLIYSIERQYTTKALNAPLFDRLRFLDINVAQNIINKIDEKPVYFKSLSLDSTARYLYSNYKSGHEYTRQEAMAKTIHLLESAADLTDNLYLQSPNEYAFQYADAVYGIPVHHSQYLFESDCVPFFQIVMSGNVPMFSQPLNTSVTDHNITLRLIEFNTYPSYTMTERSTNVLVKSNSRNVFNSKADVLIPFMLEQYREVDSILSKTKGLAMVSRAVVAEGIVVVDYEQGVQVVVNYTNHIYTHMNDVVNAKDAGVFINGKRWDDNA